MKVGGPWLAMLLIIAFSVGLFLDVFLQSLERTNETKQKSYVEASNTILASKAAPDYLPDYLIGVRPLLETKQQKAVNTREPLINQGEELLRLCQDPALVNYLKDSAEILWIDKEKRIKIKWLISGVVIDSQEINSYITTPKDLEALKTKQLRSLANLDLNKVAKTLQAQLQE